MPACVRLSLTIAASLECEEVKILEDRLRRMVGVGARLNLAGSRYRAMYRLSKCTIGSIASKLVLRDALAAGVFREDMDVLAHRLDTGAILTGDRVIIVVVTIRLSVLSLFVRAFEGVGTATRTLKE